MLFHIWTTNHCLTHESNLDQHFLAGSNHFRADQGKKCLTTLMGLNKMYLIIYKIVPVWYGL